MVPATSSCYSTAGHTHPTAGASVIPKLSRKYRVIAPDLRGLGDSSRPADGYDNASVGKDVIELMDHRTPHLPEALTAGRESVYLSWFYDEYSERASAVQPDDLAEYVRCYSQPGSMRCGFEYYRTLEISSAFVQASIERDGTRLRAFSSGGSIG
jgi:hypothetical protein